MSWNLSAKRRKYIQWSKSTNKANKAASKYFANIAVLFYNKGLDFKGIFFS